MNKSYDVYMCRERKPTEKESSFKLRFFNRILTDPTLKNLTFEDIYAMANVAWDRHLKMHKFSRK